MSHFYGSLHGTAKTEATRRGGAKDGLQGHIRTCNLGVRVVASVDRYGFDHFEVYRTGGSNASPQGEFLFDVTTAPHTKRQSEVSTLEPRTLERYTTQRWALLQCADETLTAGCERWVQFDFHYAGHFHTALFRAIALADDDNLLRLAKGFPGEAAAYAVWSGQACHPVYGSGAEAFRAILLASPWRSVLLREYPKGGDEANEPSQTD